MSREIDQLREWATWHDSSSDLEVRMAEVATWLLTEALVLPCPPDLLARIERAAAVLEVPVADYVVGAIGARLMRTGEEEPGSMASRYGTTVTGSLTGAPPVDVLTGPRLRLRPVPEVEVEVASPAAELAARILAVMPRLREAGEAGTFGATSLRSLLWTLWPLLLTDDVDLARTRSAVEEAERLVEGRNG